MNAIFAELLTVARKLNNYEKDATGATALWPTTTNYKALVPTGKRWILLGGIVYVSVSATLIGAVHDDGDNVIGYLVNNAATTGYATYPEADFFVGTPWILDAGEYVQLSFGVAQDLNAFASCVVLEVDV